MDTRLNLTLLACLALTASAQTNGDGFATGLRSKFGPPLARETFTAKPGFEMVVDYAANGNVCKIQLPPMAPDREPGVASTHAVDLFVAELVPMAIRGAELRRTSAISGVNSVSIVEYENIAIAEGSHGGTRTGVTVTFKKEQCRDQPIH